MPFHEVTFKASRAYCYTNNYGCVTICQRFCEDKSSTYTSCPGCLERLSIVFYFGFMFTKVTWSYKGSQSDTWSYYVITKVTLCTKVTWSVFTSAYSVNTFL